MYMNNKVLSERARDRKSLVFWFCGLSSLSWEAFLVVMDIRRKAVQICVQKFMLNNFFLPSFI